MKRKHLFNFTLLSLLVSILSCMSVQVKNPEVRTQDRTYYSGIVKSLKVFPRTWSEYTLFFLETDDGNRAILFNLSNVSMGFEGYSDREVRVSGSPGNGYIGWKRALTNGIIVREIVMETNDCKISTH